MKENIKKLSLKKVTVLKFEEASRVFGGTDNCPYTTDAVGCGVSRPGREDSCFACITEEETCPAGCLSLN